MAHRRHPTLHGSAPDQSSVALLLIDTINDLEFPGGEELFERALPMAKAIARLKKQARSLGIPCVYVNDNFGRWRSDFHALVEHVLNDGVRGEPIARTLKPTGKDYFILKPKHSGFFSTALELLLEHLGAKHLILTGMATNLCVVYTANDAYMRDYRLVVPGDCVASETEALNEESLKHMARFLKADTRPSHELKLRTLLRGRG